ncbi:TIGR03545 family protein [Aliiglaciecola litoralis]|uniref:TIGR03545 family protein n=1 Tax=Aliiglaciecola litoralis TaxID=582857 RepID=A0ABP3WPA9_9ALTE
MSNIIRWPGLVGFVVFVGFISAILIVFLDTWIRLAAISTLETATGAEVNIESVSHTFSPFGVTLEDIQLTDPSNPTQNQVQADKVVAQIELGPLLLNKVIIEEMTVSGVAFSQTRASKGSVYRQPGSPLIKPELLDPKKLPSVDELLARADLKTTHAINEAKQAYQRHASELQTQYDSLPAKDKLKEYKDRISALTKTDYKDPVELIAAKKKFEVLREELIQEQQKIKSFKQSVSDAKNDLAPKLANLKAAPGQDYDQLKLLIAGDQGAIEDVTRMILGDKAALWSDYLLSAYKIVAPLIKGSTEQQTSRDSGRFITFADDTNLPDIWIKKADISLHWQQERIHSHWQNITHQHERIKQPTTFSINSSASALWQSLLVNGDFRLSQMGLSANQQWDLEGIKLSDISLLKDHKLTTKIDQALFGSIGKLSVENGTMNGSGDMNFSQLRMTATGQNNLTKVIAETLSQLNSLKIKTDISGSYAKPKVSFRSDLDKQLAAALVANLSGDQQTKLVELRGKLDDKIKAVLGEKNGQLSQWLDWQKLADGNLTGVEEMLSVQFNNALDEQKDKLKNKLKDKLKDKLFNQ